MTTRIGARPEITEAQFLAQVIQVARLFHWRPYHPALSKWSERGWPDLALCRPPRLLLVELKSEKGKLTQQQREWLDDLARCPGVEAYLWKPSSFDEIVELLR
jgi:hypothetical protein